MDKIEKFINRRFPYTKDGEDCWCKGNCYWFAKILTERFTHLEIWYNYFDGHFIAMSPDRKSWYDYTGKTVYTPSTIIHAASLNYIKTHDRRYYNRLMRDCMK